MGRYQEKEEKNLIAPLAVAVFLFVLIVIASVWLYVTERVGDVLNQPETKVLSVPFSAGTSLKQQTGLTDQPSVPGTENEASTLSSMVEQTETAALPELANSDDFVRSELVNIAPGLSLWLNTDHLIRKLMLIVNDFAQGSRLEKHMRFFRLAQPFAVAEDNEGVHMAPESYRRYDDLVGALNGIDVDAGWAFYQKFRPLLQQVYAEFSYPENYSIEDIFKQAASEILAAPVIEKRVALVRPSVFYKYADPELEALNPVRKQMLRMGPENTRIIQNKVRKFVEKLVNREE